MHPAARYRVFALNGSNHFYVAAYVYNGDAVDVELINPRQQSTISYRVSAQVNGDLVRARIGRLGRFSMRFEPSGPFKPSTEPQGDCRGRRALVRDGVFVGRFALRGEQGFTTATATRARGLAIHSFREVCKGVDAGSEVERPETTLLAHRSEPGRKIDFRASTRVPPGGRITEFASVLTESSPGLEIERAVFGSGEATTGQFTFDRTTGTATVAPPGPFLGSAALPPSDSSGGPWAGDLSAEFPGVGRIALAGPDFHAKLTEREGGVAAQ